MFVSHEKDLLSTAYSAPGVKRAALKALIGPEQGWEDYVMRVIELGPEGHSPRHAHPWPHINYMIEGRGVLTIGDREHPVEPGSYAYVPAGAEHQFCNAGQGMFRFICIVPRQGHK